MAALTVAIVAAFLAVSTFLGNESVKEAIQGQTKVADANAVSRTFDTQDEIFQSDQALLIVLGQADDQSLAQAATAGNKSIVSNKRFLLTRGHVVAAAGVVFLVIGYAT
jgi:hypothetical protein